MKKNENIARLISFYKSHGVNIALFVPLKMSVIDLSTRTTSDWEAFHSNIKSTDSLIFMDPMPPLTDGPASIDLSVGSKCYLQNEGKYFEIDEEGISLLPFESLLILTEQKIALPHNVFGLVTGKGSQIFQGVFVSSGKINPAFNNYLKIGVYNGSRKKILIKRGAPLCTCVFIAMESNLSTPPVIGSGDFSRNVKRVGPIKKFTRWISTNKDWLAIVLSLFSIAMFTLTFFYGNAVLKQRKQEFQQGTEFKIQEK